MSHFLSSLSRVIKYTLVGKDEFEKRIDENPHDALAHLGYADWLDENAQTDGDRTEAAFRRSMGNWVQKHGGIPAEKPFTAPAYSLEDEQASSNPYRVSDLGNPPNRKRDELPDGVDHDHLTYRYYSGGVHGPVEGSRYRTALDRAALPSDAHWHPSRQEFSWPTYRAMEEAFRNAFVHGRRVKK